MKKFIKENWFKLSIVAILFFLILFVVYYLLIFIPRLQSSKNNSEHVSQSKENTSSDLDIQKCVKQAQVASKNAQQMQGNGTAVTANNHYNKMLGKCFVNIMVSTTYNGGVTFTNEVDDAYEQKSLIECASGSNFEPYCFIPGNVSDTGQAIFMDGREGQAQINNYMNN
jgi:hypothetical protein